MDSQQKYKPQSLSKFFTDGSTMRHPVEGTIARGSLNADEVYYTGKTDKSEEFVKKSPVKITAKGMERGRERFNIYCAVCHGGAGDAKSIMVEKGYIPPPSFHSDLIRNYPDGHIFNVITNGVRNMPSYKFQIPVKDRWLIVNYLRALQRSQNADLEDVPQNKRDRVIVVK